MASLSAVTRLAILGFFSVSVQAQCDGSCQLNTETCSGSYKSGLCQGGNDIECCYETTPYCPGQCQSSNQNLTCQGSYQSNMCPGADDVLCCQGVQPFADRYNLILKNKLHLLSIYLKRTRRHGSS
mmetsp:Transcript_6824/g.8802  ORF Transcript_6824/g.8802 Transcript_6824/m.8802 type:complete len:126 (-) Transcript_6824:823-1200(-)